MKFRIFAKNGSLSRQRETQPSQAKPTRPGQTRHPHQTTTGQPPGLRAISPSMALTYTPDPSLGMKAPDFSLPGTDGRTHTLAETKGAKAILVMFICNHCPYVIAVEDRLKALGKTYAAQAVKIIAISSNDASIKPADSFEKMKEKNYPFPYLFDETQDVAKAYGAVCTPDFFLFDQSLKLVYRGRLDDSWKDPAQVTRQELAAAIDELLADRTPSTQQRPSMGCSIKWKAEAAT